MDTFMFPHNNIIINQFSTEVDLQFSINFTCIALVIFSMHVLVFH